MPLELSTTTYGDLTMAGVAGPVTARTAPAFQKSLGDVLVTRPQAVLLDLGLVTKLDQAGVGVLLHTATRCRLQGCALALCRVPDHVREILVAERVNLPMYDTLADATETLLYAAAWR
ncbi:MAG TPA: STAS domain-containing protein [Mycobacteriales bacterium]|nr:STAS domain-containing protein [Mycobacteriales bacterium]